MGEEILTPPASEVQNETNQEVKVTGQAKDGTVFTPESPEVVAYLEKYPDVQIEAAIGSVVMEYEKTLPQEEAQKEEKQEEVEREGKEDI